jgi:hypothetical protein
VVFRWVRRLLVVTGARCPLTKPVVAAVELQATPEPHPLQPRRAARRYLRARRCSASRLPEARGLGLRPGRRRFPCQLQFAIPVCPFQLGISEAVPHKGPTCFSCCPTSRQAPSGPTLQDSTTSALYRAPLPLVEVLLNPCAHQAFSPELMSRHSFILQVHVGSLALRCLCLRHLDYKPTMGHLLCSLSMLSALDNKPTLGHLFYSICPCFQHWTTSPLWIACSVICLCSRH